MLEEESNFSTFRQCRRQAKSQLSQRRVCYDYWRQNLFPVEINLHQSFKVFHRFRQVVNLQFPILDFLSFLLLYLDRSLRRVIRCRSLFDEFLESGFSESSFLRGFVEFSLSINDTLRPAPTYYEYSWIMRESYERRTLRSNDALSSELMFSPTQPTGISFSSSTTVNEVQPLIRTVRAEEASR